MGLVNIQNTNLENGITNRNAADLFGSMAQLDPTRFHNYMEDFDYFHPLLDWAISGAGAGTQALAGVDGGVLRLTTAGADDDAEFLIKDGLGYSIEAAQNRKVYFRTRASLDDATDSEIIAGLGDTAGLTPDNGIFFRKSDGSETIDIIVRSGSAQVAGDAVATITTALFTAEWFWDGIDRVYYGVDGTPIGFLDLNGLALPVGVLAPSFGVQAGQAAVLVGDFDYILAAKERD